MQGSPGPAGGFSTISHEGQAIETSQRNLDCNRRWKIKFKYNEVLNQDQEALWEIAAPC